MPLPRLVHDSFVSYPVPRNLNYLYTFGGILTLMLGHAILSIAIGMHWAVSLGLMTILGVVSGLVLNMSGRWYATLVILLLTGLFVQAMIWLFGVLI